MTEKPITVGQSKDDVISSDPACPAYELNFCHALTKLAHEDPSLGLRFEERAIAARRPVWRARDQVEGVPAICQGWAVTSLTLSDGRRQILSILLPGDLIAGQLILQPVCPVSVEAVSDLHYRSFNRDAVITALRRHPALIDMLSKIRNEETMHADHMAADLGQRNAAERIARLIVKLSERLERRGMMREQAFDFPLRQHHIADATGLTVVHAGKVLLEFRRAGLIEIGGRTLTLLDAAGLRRIADMY